jgi:microcompartment protein CcmK/EutM
MQAFDKEKPIAIDAVVVGIVDNLEMADRAAGKKK